MNNKGILRQFDEIEDKVEKLLSSCKNLETANSQLQEKVERLEKELREKTEAEKLFTEQRDLVREKIDGLLKKLSNISELEKPKA